MSRPMNGSMNGPSRALRPRPADPRISQHLLEGDRSDSRVGGDGMENDFSGSDLAGNDFASNSSLNHDSGLVGGLVGTTPSRSRLRFRSFRWWCAARWADWCSQLRTKYPACHGIDCPIRSWGFAPAWPAWQRVFLDNHPYCSACLSQALEHRFAQCHPVVQRVRPAHRIPLGLVLISRGWLTPEQLRTGLDRQRRHGGRLGESLRALGYVHEEEVTAGLATQWACPVLFFRSAVAERHLRRVPLRLQELHSMVPVHYSEAAGVLVLAFSDGVDYSVTQAVAGMLDCRIEACLAPETDVRKNLGALQGLDRTAEITFERIRDASEKSAITGSYIERWGACRVRVVSCGMTVWVRLDKPGQVLDLVFDAAGSQTSAA